MGREQEQDDAGVEERKDKERNPLTRKLSIHSSPRKSWSHSVEERPSRRNTGGPWLKSTARCRQPANNGLSIIAGQSQRLGMQSSIITEPRRPRHHPIHRPGRFIWVRSLVHLPIEPVCLWTSLYQSRTNAISSPSFYNRFPAVP